MYLVLSIWDGEAVDPLPLHVYASRKLANAACERYVANEATAYDPDAEPERTDDDDGLAHVTCSVRHDTLTFSARVFELPPIEN